MSVREVYGRGSIRRGIVLRGSTNRRTVRIQIYQLNFLRGTALKSSKKSNDQLLSQRILKQAFFSPIKTITYGFEIFKGMAFKKYC